MDGIRKLFVFLLFVSIIACNQASRQSNDTHIQSGDSVNTISSSTFLNSKDFDVLIKKYDDPGRGIWQNPNLVLEKIGSLENKTIADIGAGTGYFTFRVAPYAFRTIAIDIDRNALDFIEERKLEFPDTLSSKIEVRLSRKQDPLLVHQEVDIILIVNTYHFIEDRVDYLIKLKSGLKKDGKLVLVDFKQGMKPVGPPESLKISPSQVIKELVDSGFSDLTVDSESLQYQYIIVAK